MTIVVPVLYLATAWSLDPKLNEHVNSTGGKCHELAEENLTTGPCGVLCHADLSP